MVVSAETAALCRERLAQLEAPDVFTQLLATRAIRNDIIGNVLKKRLYLEGGVVPRVVALLAHAGEEVVLQCLVVLASCCHVDGPEAASLAHQVLPVVAPFLQHPNLKVAASALRTMRVAVGSCPDAIHHPALQQAAVLERLAALLALPLDGTAACNDVYEAVALLMARYCVDQSHQGRLVELGALRHLSPLLGADTPRLQAAALECLTALVRRNAPVAAQVAQAPGVLPALFRLVKSGRPAARLAAARMLAYLYPSLGPAKYSQEVRVSVLPMVIRLLGAEDGPVREAAPEVLSDLISGDEVLAKAAGDADGVAKVSAAMEAAPSEAGQRGCLEALAAMCAQEDDSRQAVISSKVLPKIYAALQHSNPAIREAACRCTQSLSRSPHNVRLALAEAAALEPFSALLRDAAPAVRLAACATLNNLVLDFPAMKAAVAQSGTLPGLAALLEDGADAMRAAGLAALGNLACRATVPIKQSILQHVPLARCLKLLDDAEAVRGATLLLLRNVFAAHTPDLLDGVAADLPAVLTKAVTQAAHLLPPSPAPADPDPAAEAVENALWLVSHVAVAERPIPTLVQEPVLRLLVRALQAGTPRMQFAAAWAVCNLVWPTPGDQRALAEEREARRALLGAAGLRAALERLHGAGRLDWELAVRVSRALELLQ
eukprot:EG_transcript_4834